MEINNELFEKLKSARSLEDVCAIAKEKGINIDAEQAKEIWKKISESEVAENVMDKITDGIDGLKAKFM